MLKILESIALFFDRLNGWLGEKVSYLIYPIIGVVMFEVIMRYGLGSPTSWAHDFSVQLFGAYIGLVGGFTLLHKGHVSMELILNRLSPRVGAIVNLVSYLFCFLFLGALLWKATGTAYQSVMILEESPNPSDFTIYIFPLRVLLVIGTLFFLLQAIGVYFRNILIAIHGRIPNEPS